jgi:hypothetical protein
MDMVKWRSVEVIGAGGDVATWRLAVALGCRLPVVLDLLVTCQTQTSFCWRLMFVDVASDVVMH